MKVVILILIICILILDIINYIASRKIKKLKANLREITDEKSKQSNDLRLKGIKIDQLEKKIKKPREV